MTQMKITEYLDLQKKTKNRKAAESKINGLHDFTLVKGISEITAMVLVSVISKYHHE